MRGKWFCTAAVIVAGVVVAATAAADGGMQTGAEVCGDCHEESVESVGLGPHSVFEREGWELPERVEVSCSACHGDPTTHLDEGGGLGTMFSFTDARPDEANASCLTCHGDSHPRFALSSHAQAGMGCIDCHSIHAAEPPAPPLLGARTVEAQLSEYRGAAATCYGCHGEVFANFEYNERHRLQEGILDCTSCHNPHEPPTRALLGAFKQEACVNCHTDKGGPFIFEHGSVRTEGCTSCHTPHGSPNRHLLTFPTVASLCYSCHGEVPAFHIGFGGPVRFDLTTQCTNCHSSIHGSNFHPAFLQ